MRHELPVGATGSGWGNTHGDEHYIGTSEGLTRAKDVKWLLKSERYQINDLTRSIGTSWQPPVPTEDYPFLVLPTRPADSFQSLMEHHSEAIREGRARQLLTPTVVHAVPKRTTLASLRRHEGEPHRRPPLGPLGQQKESMRKFLVPHGSKILRCEKAHDRPQESLARTASMYQ